MAPLHRKFKQVQLRKVWLQDPALVLQKYRQAICDDVHQPIQPSASIDQMIETILSREDADLSTTSIMRAIAA